MSAITGLGDDDAERVRAQFGVSQIQVERDHVISVILSALMELKDSLTFFGGTALARTHLPAGRLSEDIDLLAMGDRRTTADELVTQINRSVLPRYGRLTWSADLAALRDVEPVTLTTDAGITIQLQLLIATGYPNWPTEVRRIEQRYSDVAPTQLRVPTLDSFVAWKAIAWFDRATPRDLYDLWLLSNEKMITRTAR